MDPSIQIDLLFGIFILFVLIGIVVLASIILKEYTKTIKYQHEEKLAIAEAQSKATSVKSFDELRTVLEYIASFYVAHETILINKDNLSEDDMTDMLEQCTAQISAKISTALSQEFKRQMLCYISADFLDYFIRKTTLTMLTQILKPTNRKANTLGN